MDPITDVRDLSNIAYGFMASKALFAALNLDIFDHLAQGPKTLEALAGDTGISSHRLETLVAACVSLGLLSRDEEQFANAPASQRYLVRGAPECFADYYRLQINRQFYPMMEQIDAALRGEDIADLYQSIADDPEQAQDFSIAQHAGSLGPAYMLAKQVDVSTRRKLLDVAGGSGAFSITLCERNPNLSATILDFPNVIEIARRFVGEADMDSRIGFLAGNALEVDWPRGQDVVLVSYLLSAVNRGHVSTLIERAAGSLAPGGLLLMHDFMLDNDRRGPKSAALWLLVMLLNDRDAGSLTPAHLEQAAKDAGFDDVSSQVLIPEITGLVVARKP